MRMQNLSLMVRRMEQGLGDHVPSKAFEQQTNALSEDEQGEEEDDDDDDVVSSHSIKSISIIITI
jgi:hypothetical protein